ncbi:MAG: 23S rRNA (guanosine(2251)-2'-O)-methyltransferase RlmB [Cyclobacteriaceae bacterium]|jgi:23S rRNA (guanosine2251-2'-O)-methyltransferase|nr:23S rRNA (guanosine(2251)-2'-O)-methyltransferase RlmB [Cyclobacteriaceae bacterium]
MEKKDMIYGTRAVIEAIRAGREVEKIMVQHGLANELVKELFALAKEHDIPILPTHPDKLKRLSTKNHQGVISVLSAIQYANLDNIIHQTYTNGQDPFVLIVDRVTDVRNFGAIARTAECAGIHAIVIGEKGNAPITSDAVKTSAGALNFVPVCRERDLKKTIRSLREQGLKIIACTEKTKSLLYETNCEGPVAIIMGSEEDGISDMLLKEADALAAIPMKGKIGSLNVSVAAGIAMYEIVRQRESKK